MVQDGHDVLLDVRGLVVEFPHDTGQVRPVDGVSLAVRPGERVALVGESGSGKSLTALSILGLVPPPGVVNAGQIRFAGRSVLDASSRQRRLIRGGAAAMIFQEPMTSLNPVFTAGEQIVESIRLHRRRGASPRRRAIDLLAQVGIPDPARAFRAYPHELSGGMRQRVMIAMALAGEPSLLIADEPTTALDVTVQARVLDLLTHLCDARGMSLLLITHDLGVVARVAQRTYVMYAGRIVERAPTRALLKSPAHPYTAALLECAPRLDRRADRLPTINGSVPPLTAIPGGCRFYPRCCLGADEARCANEDQTLITTDPSRAVACWKRAESAAIV